MDSNIEQIKKVIKTFMDNNPDLSGYAKEQVEDAYFLAVEEEHLKLDRWVLNDYINGKVPVNEAILYIR